MRRRGELLTLSLLAVVLLVSMVAPVVADELAPAGITDTPTPEVPDITPTPSPPVSRGFDVGSPVRLSHNAGSLCWTADPCALPQAIDASRICSKPWSLVPQPSTNAWSFARETHATCRFRAHDSTH